jgi:hypothetical protein
MFGGFAVVAKAKTDHSFDSPSVTARVQAYIATSLRDGREYSGTIADLRRLERRAPAEDREFYKAAEAEARRQLREFRQRVYGRDEVTA